MTRLLRYARARGVLRAAAVILGLGLILWAAKPAARPLTILPGDSHAAGEVLVKYRDGDRAAAAERHHQRLGTRTLKFFEAQGLHRIQLPDDMDVKDALELFRQDPRVEYAEPNYFRRLGRIPNDASYSSLWGLFKINAPGAWDLTTDCSSVVVAVIDSGVDYDHPDLSANIWVNTNEIAGNGLDDDGNGKFEDIRGWDFAYEDNDPMDVIGHGTHVAGTIGAVGDNALGVTGLCWEAKIMALRAFDDDGNTTVAATIEAMEYARLNGAKIVNASYADREFSQAEKDMIAQLNSDGILFVAAAGNEGVDSDQTPSYPAGYHLPNIIAVAASNENDGLASFSNFGLVNVHVAAPGDGVFSTYPDDGYGSSSGTSMAAPHVSGLAALVWGSNPGLSAAQVKDRILDGADRTANLEGFIFTAGAINASNSVRNIPAPPSSFTAAGVSDRRVDVSWDDNYSDAIRVRIERRASEASAFVEIAAVEAGLSVYQDTSAGAATTYTYRARSDNGENTSVYTAEASATTAAGPDPGDGSDDGSAGRGGGGGGGGGGCFITSLSGR